MKLLLVLILIGFIGSVTSMTASRTSAAVQNYLGRFQWPLRGVHTRNNDWGGGRTIYLDRHRSDCGIGAVAQFHYVRKKFQRRWTRFRYDTVCIMPIHCINKCPASIRKLDRTMCKFLHTRPNKLGVWGGLSTNYLDRHYVKCPTRMVLTNFKFMTHGRRVYYHYRCCPARMISCHSYNTPLKAYGNFSTIYLDRQVVKVPNVKTMAMTGFRLLTNYHRKGFYYHVDYCVVKGR